MQDNIFRVGILGAGNIAGSMAEAVNGLGESVKLAAIASRSLLKAERFRERFGAERAYGSYEELARDDSLDLIYIATPHSEHFKNAALCIENGRNCLVEKAFTANRTEAEGLIRLAKEHKVFLAEAMWTRYQPSYPELKSVLDSGEIGNVHYLESNFAIHAPNVERLNNPSLCGGALLDLGVYSLTVPAMYLGTDIRRIKTEAEMLDTGVDFRETVTLTYPDGTMARVRASFLHGDENKATIIGDRGYLEFGPINVPRYARLYEPDGTLRREFELPLLVNGYEYELLSCKKAIENGEKEAPELPLSETLRIMGWMDSLREHWRMVYPFEDISHIRHDLSEVWGEGAAFDDENPWDRSDTESFLEVFDTVTGNRLTLARFDGVIEAPNWSHDGSFLTYNSEGRIYRYELSDNTFRPVPSGTLDRINNDHVLSADDTEIAVSDESSPDGKSRIYRVLLDGPAVTGGPGEDEPLLVTPEAPSYLHGWTPDKKSLLYCAERNGEYDIYRISENGGPETRLTTAPRLNDGCEYDARGEYIYFNSVRTGLMQAWRMKADGSEETQLTFDTDRNTWFPHISPDGTKLIMLSYKKGDLWPGDHIPNREVEIRMMNADGTGLHTILTLFGGQGTLNVNSWSPDNRRFAFVSYRRKEQKP